jgi:membrane-associated phospholipid phosphatase
MLRNYTLAILIALAVSRTAAAQDLQDPPASQEQQVQVDQTAQAPQAAPPAQQPPAQDPDQIVRPIETARTPSTIKKIMTNFAHDQKGIWTSPFHIDRDNAKWWALFGGGTAGLLVADKHLTDALPDSPNSVKFSKKVSQIGAVYTTLPIAGGLYLYGRLRKDPKARETGVLGAETLLDSYMLVAVLKLAFGRERPDEGQGEGRFFKAHHGFPSGHSIMTWSFASLISHEYAPGKVVPILAYSYAAIVSASRFTARKHFAGDILAGGAMGWFIGRYVFQQHLDPNIHKRFNPPIALAPYVNPVDRSYGFSLALKR